MLVLNGENDHHGLPDTIVPMESGTVPHSDGHPANLHIQAVSGVQ